MDRHRQLSINLITSIIAFIINIGISFFLTPYITKNIGVEAYGFISLGTNFINYASLVTIALNSMAGRFITIEIHRNNWECANKYFSSVLYANIIVAGILVVPSILCVTYIDKIVNVPTSILTDVRLLFAFLFANYLISIITSSFGVSTFATNKLYLKSLRETESKVIKVVILILLFFFFKPTVSYIGFATLITSIYVIVFNIYYMAKFLPQIKIKKRLFDMKVVMELIYSGIWNSINQVGNILLQGLDLLVSNLFISSTSMGILALSKTIPTVILSLIGVINSIFLPDFTILYAQDKSKELLISIKSSMKILGVISTIPIAILTAFGKDFFRLWVPNQDSNMLQILSIISISTIVVSGTINSLYGIFTVTNKIKINSIVLLISGILNVLIVFFLLHTTNLGIYAIAGVSSVLGILRNLLFTAPFGAKCLGLKWTTFYPEILKGVLAFIIVTSLGLFINYLYDINTWLDLFITSAITSCLGLMLNINIVLGKSDIQQLLKLIKSIKHF